MLLSWATREVTTSPLQRGPAREPLRRWRWFLLLPAADGSSSAQLCSRPFYFPCLFLPFSSRELVSLGQVSSLRFAPTPSSPSDPATEVLDPPMEGPDLSSPRRFLPSTPSSLLFLEDSGVGLVVGVTPLVA